MTVTPRGGGERKQASPSRPKRFRLTTSSYRPSWAFCLNCAPAAEWGVPDDGISSTCILETASFYERRLCPSARGHHAAHVISRLRDSLGDSECHKTQQKCRKPRSRSTGRKRTMLTRQRDLSRRPT